MKTLINALNNAKTTRNPLWLSERLRLSVVSFDPQRGTGTAIVLQDNTDHYQPGDFIRLTVKEDRVQVRQVTQSELNSMGLASALAALALVNILMPSNGRGLFDLPKNNWFGV